MVRWLGFTVVVLMVAPLAQAAWSVPEGEPYEAEVMVVDARPAIRDSLVFQDGLLAGLEHPWGQRAERWGSVFVWQWNGSAFHEVLSNASGGAATAVAAGHGHVAWLTDTNPGGGTWETALFLQGIDEETPELLSGSAVHSTPVINGKWLTWSSRPLGLPDGVAAVHRLDLDDGVHESWPSPRGACESWVASLGKAFVMSGGLSCYTEGHTGLVLWRPDSETIEPLSPDPSPFLMMANGDSVLWTAYREEGERGTNVYIHNASTGAEQRVSMSPGRECCASLSGSLVAWLDLRSEGDSPPRDGRVPYSIYFKDLATANEYQVQGTMQPTGGPALDDRLLAYNDAEGRLLALQLPESSALLQVHPEAWVEAVEQTVANATSIVVDLVSNVPVDVAWDLDGDGTFEAEGPITIDLEAEADPWLLGRAVDSLGRVAVLAVHISTLAPALRGNHVDNGDNEADATPGRPVPGPPILLLPLLLGALGALRRRRT